MDTDITQLAKMMRARRAAGVAPYTLLLGSSLSLTPAVRRAVCDSEGWEAFWETVSRTSPAERRALMHEPLSQLDLQAGCDALAQLVGAGYFNVVLTLNVDDALDNALQTLPASEYRVWVHGEVSSQEIVAALERPTPRIKAVKLRGDMNAYKLPLTAEATFEFPQDLEDAVMRLLRHDTVIVGDLLPFDDDVQRCIRGGDGALWVIAAEESGVLSLSKGGFLGRAKRIRKVGEVIAAEFNAFFSALVEALGLGEAEEAGPEMAFVPPEKRVNPYRGLEPFEPEHARYFFGRELLTEMLVEQLWNSRFLAVLGASGSGKSSVVRAGVVPALEQGKLPGSGNWPVLVMKPGQNPQEALAGALVAMVGAARGGSVIDYARLQQTRQEIQERLFHEESALHELVTGVVAKDNDDRRAVVVIDQFEELFTLCPFEQRQRFIDTLLYAVGQPEGCTAVLLTLRADFVAQCTAYPDLSDLISSHQVWVRAMNDVGLRAAIELPAWAMGMRYEPGLVPLILADVGREPGALPLLEDALWSLFEHCREGNEVIEVRQYREVGGVQGALAKRAEDVYATLSAEEQQDTRRILLRLVEVREGQEPMRQRAALDELLTATEERAFVEKVVQRLTDARLLTTTQDVKTGQRVVDISHEALIRGWPRLRGWIDEDRVGLRTHRRLTETALEWDRLRRDKSVLYRGARLVEAEEWARAHPDAPNLLECEFLDASLALRRGEQRRQRLVMSSALVAALIFGLLAFVTFQQRNAFERQSRIAQSRALAAYAEGVEDHQLAVLLGLEAVYQTHRNAPGTMTAEAGSALYRVMARSRWQATFSGHTSLVSHVAWNSDDTRIVTVSEDGSAKVWDAQTGTELFTLSGHTSLVSHAAWNSDDTRIVTASWDGTAKVWDTQTGKELLTLSGHSGSVLHVAWSSDNMRIVTTSSDRSAKVWDAATGRELLTFSGHTNWVYHAAWNSDDTRIVTTSGGPLHGSATVWDAQTGKELFTLSGHTDKVLHAAWNSDDTRIVTASWDGTAKVWDTQTGKEFLTLSGHSGPVRHAAWNSDDTRILTASWDGTAKVWDAQTGAEFFTLSGHTDRVHHAAWNTDDMRIVTVSRDGTAKVWDAQTGVELFTLSGHTGEVRHASWNSDGTRIVTASWDGTAKVWNAQIGVKLFTLSGHSGSVRHAAWNSDGTRIVTISGWSATVWDAQTGAELFTRWHTGEVRHAAWNSDGTRIVTISGWSATVWDAATGALLFILSGHTGEVRHVVWNSDGTRIVTASWDGTAKVWDAQTGAKLSTLSGHTGDVLHAAWNSDDTRILTVSGCSVKVWDAQTGAELFTLSGHTGEVYHAAWNSDDTRILTASSDGSAKVWDAGTGAELFTLGGHSRPVLHAAWNSDDTRIVTASWDNTAKVWDAQTGRELFTLSGHIDAVLHAAWNSDDTRIVTASRDGTAKVWDARTGAEFFTLSGHTAAVNHAAWNSDGTRILTASNDGSARIYFAKIDGPGGLIEFACTRTGRNMTSAEWRRYMGDDRYRQTCPNLPPGD